MNKFITRIATGAAGLVLVASTAWAAGTPSTPYPVEFEGKVEYVYPQRLEIQMDNGTLLQATSAQQLANIKPGTSVRVLYVNNGQDNEIQNIEVTQ